MKNEGGGNTHPRHNSFSEVFFSNPSAIRMAPSSPIMFAAVQPTQKQQHQYPTLSEHSLSSGEHLPPNNIRSHQKSEVCSVETHNEGQCPQEIHSSPTFLLFSWHVSLQFHSLSFIHSTLMT